MQCYSTVAYRPASETCEDLHASYMVLDVGLEVHGAGCGLGALRPPHD